ncbi:MAG: NAD(P)-binding protein [Pseudomonadales bacterium]|jgi:spermidine dehydrogenase|nr:NAD(P)-binding protein [Kiritimatiellia bacterium]MDP6970025.1 NAD(P)-binding protein [Pseudomonadales bacterium]
MSREEHELGIDRDITRRDFLNASALGVGAGLLSSAAPAANASMPAWNKPVVDERWYGPGGIGDYRDSHGHTPDVVTKAHAIRDGHFDKADIAAESTGEIFDAVVVGGGMAGLGAAYHFMETAGDSGRCLVLDNHPVFGGVAKQNEFMVNGERLISPQGANGFSIPDFDNEAQDFAGGDAYWYRKVGIPEAFTYPQWADDLDPMTFCGDHYGFLHWRQPQISTGRFYRTESGQQLVKNPMLDAFANAPLSKRQRDDLNRWFTTGPANVPQDVDRWLDSMTYQQYLEGVLGLDRSVTEYINPVIASGIGLGADCVSAYSCMNIALPGFSGISAFSIGERHSFPGGNAGFARHFLKRLIPDAIRGGDNFDDIIANGFNDSAFDREGNKIRMRLGATVVRVEHTVKDLVSITYAKGDRVYRVLAKGVTMAGGGWINRKVVRDMPKTHLDAYGTFVNAPMLVANVALNNFRFMYNAGISSCLYEGEFGYECSIRKPMHTASYQPPLHPDQPTVLTFYVPFPRLGMGTREQAVAGLWEMYGTSYRDYELKIRRQLSDLFGQFGFDAKKDIEGIILNRWGHAYIVPEPGFFFGNDGAPAARDVVSQPAGRITFGHSELRGNQHWGPAAMEGKRAMSQLMEMAAL